MSSKKTHSQNETEIIRLIRVIASDPDNTKLRNQLKSLTKNQADIWQQWRRDRIAENAQAMDRELRSSSITTNSAKRIHRAGGRHRS
jgi:hypothetical protein